MVDAAAPTDPPLPPRLGFGAALFLVIVAGGLFANLFGAALGSTPGAAAGLAIFLVPTLLTMLFARQLWRWISHEPCGGARGTASGAKVAPERLQQELRGAVLAVEAANELRPAHEPAPRPVVAPAGAPDAPFLARCDDAAAALAAELAAADDAQRAAMLKQLRDKYQLRWEAAAAGSGGTVEDDAEVPASFVAAARELRELAMRFPASAAPLAQGAFAWDVPPLRAGGEAAVARALRAWTERTSSAADSALFASMGLWISPFAVQLFAAVALPLAPTALAPALGAAFYCACLVYERCAYSCGCVPSVHRFSSFTWRVSIGSFPRRVRHSLTNPPSPRVLPLEGL